jgi:hypothetical protein
MKCVRRRTAITAMSRSTRDLIYRIFVITHVAPTLLMVLPLVIPPGYLPSWTRLPSKWYIDMSHDPLLRGKSLPGGWFGGLCVCEVLLQLPYFLWALTIPIGTTSLEMTLTLGDQRLELPSLAYSVHTTTATFAVVCELFAFSESVVPKADLIRLASIYIPFQAITAMMAIDMYKRVRRRLSGAKQE